MPNSQWQHSFLSGLGQGGFMPEISPVAVVLFMVVAIDFSKRLPFLLKHVINYYFG
jgi:hypothetical protein